MAYLSNDILYMLCTQLWHQRDFNTLFSCACSGKRLALIAIPNLYRMQFEAPLIIDSYEVSAHIVPDSTKRSDTTQWSKERITKCAALWRAIILSCQGKTLYPYCQYIRTLNLQLLEELLEQPEVRAGTSKELFPSELAQFQVYSYIQDFVLSENGASSITRQRLDPWESINRIGEVITKQTPLLEVLMGRVSSGELSRWIPRLPRLTRLALWGRPLDRAATKDNGTLIRLHCPSFKALHLHEWSHSNSDPGLAAFVNELRPQSLESFKTVTSHESRPQSFASLKTFTRHNVALAPEVFQALNCHGESLIELKLNVCTSGAIPYVMLLRSCTNLVSLTLVGRELRSGRSRLEDSTNPLETVAWLKECKKLRILAFSTGKINSLPFQNSIRLTSLHCGGPGLWENKEFNQALANQTSLQSLWLEGGAVKDALETDVLVDSLTKLVNLTSLRLGEMSKSFVDRHIVQLAGSLPKLKVLSTGGSILTDAIWDDVATLKSLRTLDLSALTSFTSNGILGFIEKLGPHNKGLVLSVIKVDVKRNTLSCAEKKLIQEMMDKKINGRFEYGFSTRPSPWVQLCGPWPPVRVCSLRRLEAFRGD